MTYKLIANSASVLRVEDGAFIPNDPENLDRVAYERFVDGGGVPMPADPVLDTNSAAAQVERQRSAAIEELQRLMSQGVSQAEINAAILNLLTE